jgi:hypothetical protein
MALFHSMHPADRKGWRPTVFLDVLPGVPAGSECKCRGTNGHYLFAIFVVTFRAVFQT